MITSKKKSVKKSNKTVKKSNKKTTTATLTKKIKASLNKIVKQAKQSEASFNKIKQASHGQYYVSSYNDDERYYYADASPVESCWTRNVHHLSRLTFNQAKKILKEHKESQQYHNLTIHSLDGLENSLLCDVSEKLWGDRWEGDYEISSMLEEIERLRTAEYQLQHLKDKLGDMRSLFAVLMSEDFAA